MKPTTIHLGFEIPSGDPVAIPVAHMCVTGQTQAAGKTTTLEALVDRSGLKAIAFVTKRGEGAFKFNHTEFERKNVLIQPYFRHRADWQFVSDILGAILSEKLKFQRPWIIQVCRGAKTLRDVQANVVTRLHGDKKKKIRPATGMAQGVFTELEAYFELLLPEIEQLPYTDKLVLEKGLNVMDLSEYSTPLQMLVVSSTLECIYKHETGVVTVIPEAWEFVPNGKSSPAKSAAIQLIRKGAGLKNFIWVDSQDLVGIDTIIRNACGVWVLGVQRGRTEVKRTLEHVPDDIAKPKVADIMQLQLGQYFVCYGHEVKKVYVQPKWMGPVQAYERATGHQWEGRDSELDELYASLPEFELDRPAALAESDLDSNLKLISSGEMIAEPDNTPKIEDYAVMPAGLPYTVDNDFQYPRPGALTGKKETEVTNQEHDQKVMSLTEGYEKQIKDLKVAIYHVLARIPGSYASRHTLAEWAGKLPSVTFDPTLEDDEAVTVRKPIIYSPASDPRNNNSLATLVSALLQDSVFRSGIVALIPAGGTIKVEPREVVLKDFQEQETQRILSSAASLSPFAKKLIAYLEARDTGVKKSAAVTAVTGKRFTNMARDCAEEYSTIRELASAGFIREDTNNSLVYPNLGVIVKKRVAEFEPTTQDIEDIIGQVMLKLK